MRASTPTSSRTLTTSEVLSSPLGASLSCRREHEEAGDVAGLVLDAARQHGEPVASRPPPRPRSPPCPAPRAARAAARALLASSPRRHARAVRRQPLPALRQRLRMRDDAADASASAVPRSREQAVAHRAAPPRRRSPAAIRRGGRACAPPCPRSSSPPARRRARRARSRRRGRRRRPWATTRSRRAAPNCRRAARCE